MHVHSTRDHNITYQDLAMNVALQIKLSTIFHRLCKWHITHKMRDKVGSVYRNKKKMDRFHKVLNSSESIILSLMKIGTNGLRTTK